MVLGTSGRGVIDIASRSFNVGVTSECVHAFVDMVVSVGGVCC